jgi:peptidyl-prolyl cis-trans isomerase SurA
MSKIIALFIFFVLFLPGSSSHAAVLLDRVVAVVNKEVITWSELYKMMESEATEQMKALNEAERMKVFKENEALFLEKLIDMRLQIQEAKRLGLEVGNEEVKEAVENIKKKYQLTDKALEESLNKEGLTLEEYKKRLSDQILLSQFVNKRIKSKIVISDEQVKRYMEANKERFSESEAFRLRQIFFKQPKDDYGKRALEEKATLILQRLKAGEDFATLAGEFSEDTSSKQGGDLGYIKKNSMAREFIDILSTMNPGDVSVPFWTERGLHIIRLEEKTEVQSQDVIKEKVRNKVAEEQFLEKYESFIKGLRETAHIEIRL